MIKKNKLIVVITILLFIIVSNTVLADTLSDKYKPDIFESWDETQGGVLYNFWHSLNPFIDGKNELDMNSNADIYSWYNGTFFGLANWEREVCLADLSTDVRNFRDSFTSQEQNSNIYTTTITASAIRTIYYNTSLYEVSWYFAPYENDLEYKVYLSSEKVKEYFVGKTGKNDSSFVIANRIVGANGYNAKYLDNKFDELIIEYKSPESTEVKSFKVKVVENKN